MSNLMEVLVRPFAPIVIRPPATPPTEAGVTQEPIEFSLGGSGGRTMSLKTARDGGVVLVDNANKYKESSRESTKVRVENEDDPDQFVEFCRADKVQFTPVKKGQNPPSTSSYDTSGGYHSFSASDPQGERVARSSDDTSTKEYNFKYPTDKKTCKSQNEPPKGCK
jgi:hypothetical protein